MAMHYLERVKKSPNKHFGNILVSYLVVSNNWFFFFFWVFFFFFFFFYADCSRSLYAGPRHHVVYEPTQPLIQK